LDDPESSTTWKFLKRPWHFTIHSAGSTQSCMFWFGAGSADKDCTTSQPGNMLLVPRSSAVIYFAFQFPAAIEYAPSKQTVARCSRKLVNHTQFLESFPKGRK